MDLGDGRGNTYELPYTSNNWWSSNNGVAWGTNGYTPPDYSNWYTRLNPR